MTQCLSYSLVVVSLFAAACGATASTGPESTTLQIGHRVGGGRVAGASPIELSLSTGMFADLEIFEPGALEGGGYAQEAENISPAVIQSAISSDETVLHIDSFRGSYAKIEGLRPGTVDVTFQTDHGTRTFQIHVAEPALVELDHFVWDRLPEGAQVAFVRGGIARFGMTRRDMAHRVLGGYGAALPVRVDPPRAARLSIRDGDVERVDVHLEQDAEEVTLRPLGGHPVTFPIVDAAEDDTWGVSAIDPEGGEMPLDGMEPGRRTLVSVWSKRTDGTRLFGLVGRASLVALDPAVCETENLEDVYGDGVYRVDALTDGECRLEIQIGDLTIPVAFPVGSGTSAPAETAGTPDEPAESEEETSAE